jgi:uncharacterized sodium:solute symporter family permease YidK
LAAAGQNQEAQMRKTYRVLAYALAVEVVVQAMAIAYGIAGLGKWVDDGHGHALTKKLAESNAPDFTGAGGFAAHGLNGTLIIPVLVLALLIVSFFAKVPGGRKRAAILLGLVVLQVVLGMALHAVPFIALLHVLNAFAILVMAILTGYSVGKADPLPAAGQPETVSLSAVGHLPADHSVDHRHDEHSRPQSGRPRLCITATLRLLRVDPRF